MTDTSAALNQDLWRHVWAAVVETRALAQGHIDRGGYVSRVSMPSVSTFDGGWPNLHGGRYLGSGSGPPDLSSLFGFEQDVLHPFAFADVPALAALIDFVRGRDEVREALAPAPRPGVVDAAFLDRLVAVEAAGLALELLDRAVACGVADDDLEPLYLELERGLFNEALDAELVVPLLLFGLELAEPFGISDQIRLEPLDPLTQAARATRESSIDTVPATLLGAATHAVVISGLLIPNAPRWNRVWRAEYGDLPLDLVDRAVQSLRIAVDADLGYAQVIVRPLGWADRWTYDLPALVPIATIRRYPQSFDHYGWLRERAPIATDAIRDVPEIFEGLSSADARTRLASRRLASASLRSDSDDITIDACIGIEALLSEGKDELSHRLSLRAAAALSSRSTDPLSARRVYELTKRVYAHRSAIVHGLTKRTSIQLPEGSPELPPDRVAVFLLRNLLAHRLRQGAASAPAALDELILARLDSEDGEQ